ncbi:MAG: (Fe-S)-binding protein [Microscillaceae bacterium]|nr:(Fe-S)-binding protein [Microscillaceae bacterium]
MTVELFIPCYIDRFFPQTGMNTVKILEKLGCQVNYNPKQTCCGLPAYQSGYSLETEQVAAKFVKDFAESSGFLVAPSAYCVHMIRNVYDRLLEKQASELCYQLQKRTFELSEFVTDVLETQQIEGAALDGLATFHDSCLALRACGIYEAPRLLLQHVKGLSLIDMRESENCCGFGGGLPGKFSELSVALAEQKIDCATATQADYLISTDATCLMHLDGYIRKNRKKLQIMHIADVLASGW